MEHAAEHREDSYDCYVPGTVSEQRSYLRWEEPMLGVNGEGRITPLAPGCQPSVTVIGKDGEDILRNHIFRTTAGSEGGGDEGQLAIDMSPTQPHTNGRPRSCASCHGSEKAMGHGIGGGRINRPWDKPTVVELMTVDREILPKNYRTQIESIAGLEADWSRIVTEEGKQLQTVGHHLTGSRPLNNEERAMLDRRGVCVACHQEIPTESLAVSFLHHVAKATGQLPETAQEHNSLLHKMLLFAAWGQTLPAVLGPLAVAGGAVWLIRRRRRRRVAEAATPAGE
jgi:hypothetical protein